MASIEKRVSAKGDTSYRVRINLKGHKATATFPRKKDASAWASRTESAIRENRYAPEAAAYRYTLGDLIAVYDAVLNDKRPQTAYSQRAQLQWWQSKIGAGRKLGDINVAEIKALRDEKAAEASATTANRYHAALRHALEVARREHGWLTENPARRIAALREPEGRVRWLEPDEINRLLDATKHVRSPALYPIVVLALTTGARYGEIISLRWSDLDLARRRVTFEVTKNRERRSVTITPEALEAFEIYGTVRRIDTDLLFPGRKQPPRPMSIRTAWEKSLKRADISNFRFHDLRHTAASYLAMNGASELDIAAVLGHKTLQMVKRYSHLADSHVDAAVDRASRAMLAGASGCESK